MNSVEIYQFIIIAMPICFAFVMVYLGILRPRFKNRKR